MLANTYVIEAVAFDSDLAVGDEGWLIRESEQPFEPLLFSVTAQQPRTSPTGPAIDRGYLGAVNGRQKWAWGRVRVIREITHEVHYEPADPNFPAWRTPELFGYEVQEIAE